MNQAKFNFILNSRLKKSKEILKNKAKEYAQDKDRLHNFKVAAQIDNETVAEALWGMFKKHLVCLLDMKNGTIELTEELIDEKIGDAINYLILLEAIFIEELEK